MPDELPEGEREALLARIRALEEQNDELVARFHALSESLDVGVVIQGPETEMLFANPKACELLGLSEDQLLGKTSYDPRWSAARADGSPFPGEERPMAVALRTRAPVHGVTVGIFRPERGDRVWLHVSAVPELDSQGELVQVVATFTDITERKLVEDLARAQADEILDLSTPFIPLSETVGLVLVVGTLDGARAARLFEAVLPAVSSHGSRVVIVDLTSVPAMDPDGRGTLARLGDACRLLGAEVVITGLRGNAARALAAADAPVGGFATLGSLAAGVRYAFTRTRRPGR